MSQFESGQIIIQANTNLGWNFKFPTATSATAKGGIPYGRTISTVSVIAYDEDDSDVTSEMIVGTPSLDTETVTVRLKYPVTSGVGRYKLTFILTLDNGMTVEFDFKNVYAKNI